MRTDYLVEIWFEIEKDADGYPASKSAEQLLAEPTDKVDEFRVQSVPFYLKNVSRGDVVRAKTTKVGNASIFQFDGVVVHGGHNTYRLLLKTKHPGDPAFTVGELTTKGLAVEEQHGNFLAVDVPPNVDQQVIDEYLVSQSESGRWEIQDGYLHTIHSN